MSIITLSSFVKRTKMCRGFLSKKTLHGCFSEIHYWLCFQMTYILTKVIALAFHFLRAYIKISPVNTGCSDLLCYFFPLTTIHSETILAHVCKFRNFFSGKFNFYSYILKSFVTKMTSHSLIIHNA